MRQRESLIQCRILVFNVENNNASGEFCVRACVCVCERERERDLGYVPIWLFSKIYFLFLCG